MAVVEPTAPSEVTLLLILWDYKESQVCLGLELRVYKLTHTHTHVDVIGPLNGCACVEPVRPSCLHLASLKRVIWWSFCEESVAFGEGRYTGFQKKGEYCSRSVLQDVASKNYHH